MKLSTLKAKPQSSEARWIDNIPGLPGLRLQVRPLGNSDDRRIQAEQFEALPVSARMRGALAQHQQDGIIVERLVGAVLVGWDGLSDDNDQPLAFSADQSRTLLSDPEMSAFRDAVMWAATLAAAEATEARDADVKN